MKHHKRLQLLWFASVLLLIALSLAPFLYLQAQLTPEQLHQVVEWLGDRRYLLILPTIVLLGLVAFASHWVLEQVWGPIGQVAEELQAALDNPSGQQIQTSGATVIEQLTTQLNRQIEQTVSLQTRIATQVQQAQSTLEREKNVLAALVEELREGVIVCNREGLILLYNRAARKLLGSEGSGLGLGREIHQAITTPLLGYSLNELRGRRDSGRTNLIQPFTFWQGSRMIRAQALGVLEPSGQLGGFVLVCEELSPRPESHPLGMLEQVQQEKRRTSIGGVRASVEMLLDFPEMPEEKQRVFLEAIHSHTLQLSELLESTTLHTPEAIKAHCPLEPTSALDWLDGLLRHHEGAPPLRWADAEGVTDFTFRVNSFLLNQALSFLFRQVHQALQISELECRLHREGRFAMLDFSWSGRELPKEELRSWLGAPIESSDGASLSITEILQRHDAEVWFEGGDQSQQHGLRFFLPAEASTSTVQEQTPLSFGSRPIFYDFDLFEKSAQSPELLEVPLSELRYTVFDTETTGLNPSGGDEIIAIGAYRIVNGRLLENETFEQLIDPQREIGEASVAIHGITLDQLVGKPLVTEVLPRFHRFAEGSVLLAHNAAFDMRFLQIKELSSGIRFKHPVLDTLLLSAVAQPKQESHSLDEIARRFGVVSEKRHSATGDAKATAQVFLKLLPLLEEKGIRTLQQALEASRETYYAKLKY
jgi:DNA polymerase-3 subunit epsilon